MESRLVTLPTSGALGLALCAGLATLAGCATAGSVAHASMSAAPTTLSTPSSTTTSPTLGPESITIVSRRSLGGNRVLRVTAPADTRFRIGPTMELAVPCPATVEKAGDPTAYRVVCPASPHGSQLIATISLGDFEYSFFKSL
ncbi:hypothetical protein [Nostocoides sp. HKS02]|uniref:hypothetical protein n=1 Tax=Nostocoides sp. HKS02 TaxID=1813880 RepID=UPI0012B468E1|nr:hypothetical protein [Tetrasphaera sp. HKS02]QGN59032.1 hypothetical protein GKE56_15360 [Tetrasphaera sp. HKS02]